MIDTETQAEGETGRVQVGNGDREDTEVGEIDKVQMGRTMRQDKWKTDPQRWDQNRSRKTQGDTEMQTTEKWSGKE